ncbi:hypothetical protein RHGRI_011045 [Rhododendron griersonianum]|uniref:Uncharacterized protein n=1 Tax=Rhododendron griersonianum TaxID=479676 RepID=A0AAV6KLH3_9ERIC|nr:hypothetical protein RHGRI_011045 [Rhododendron griersonianum]
MNHECAFSFLSILSPLRFAGYIVLESFSSPEEVNEMRSIMDQLLDKFDCSSYASIFSTKNQVFFSGKIKIKSLTQY